MFSWIFSFRQSDLSQYRLHNCSQTSIIFNLTKSVFRRWKLAKTTNRWITYLSHSINPKKILLASYIHEQFIEFITFSGKIYAFWPYWYPFPVVPTQYNESHVSKTIYKFNDSFFHIHPLFQFCFLHLTGPNDAFAQFPMGKMAKTTPTANNQLLFIIIIIIVSITIQFRPNLIHSPHTPTSLVGPIVAEQRTRLSLWPNV